MKIKCCKCDKTPRDGAQLRKIGVNLFKCVGAH